MICMWQELVSILPIRWRAKLSGNDFERLTEIRLRLGQPVELVLGSDITYLPEQTQREDLLFCINTASQYSPWTSTSVSNGYITAPGGHRLGLCGSVTIHDGSVSNISDPTSLCIRVAKDYPGCAAGLAGSEPVLILGRPGSGKTTLLRDMIRQLARRESVCVVDERQEIFPKAGHRFCFSTGKRTDVLSGCPKARGIDMVLRSMGPDWIVMDEITSREDTQALLECAWCGVKLLATAHAGSLDDFKSRPVYRPLVESGIFRQVLLFSPDKPYTAERIRL